MELLNDINNQLYYIPRSIILSGIILFVFMCKEEKEEKIKEKIKNIVRQPTTLLFVLYFSFLIESTLLGRWHKNPFNNIFGSFGIFNESGLNKEFIENVLLFVPYTLLFLLRFSTKRSFKDILILSILTTCFIEVCQLVFWVGEFQLSDIVHNVLGGVVGYLLWIVINCLWHHSCHKKI